MFERLRNWLFEKLHIQGWYGEGVFYRGIFNSYSAWRGRISAVKSGARERPAGKAQLVHATVLRAHRRQAFACDGVWGQFGEGRVSTYSRQRWLSS